MMPTRRILAHAVTAALALQAAPTLAAATAAADTPLQDTIIVTATRQAESAALFSGSIGVVDRDALEQVAHVHINEALARVPGTWISRGNGQEHLTAVRSPVYTGPGSCGAFYMAEDGVPIRPAGFCNVNQLFEIHTEQAQRIEVLRGPGGALHGANALHGVINVISQAPAEQRETRLALEAGPDDYYRVKASHSDRQGHHGLRLGFTGTTDGGYKDDSGYDQQKLSLRHDWQGDGIRVENLLSYTNLNQETAGYILGRNSYRDSSRKRENPFPEAFRDNRASRAHSRISIDTAGGGQWVLTPYLRYQRMRFLQHFLPGQPLEENGLRSAGWQLAHYWPTQNGLSLIAGSDGEFTRAYLKETQFNPAGPPFPLGKHYDYEVDALGVAAFLRAEYAATEAIRLNAGVRVEHQRYDYDNRMIDGNTREDGTLCPTPDGACRYARPANRNDDFTDYSVSLGAIHDLGGGHSLTANLARGFRAPQAAELYRLQQGQLTADLDSEEMDALEDIGDAVIDQFRPGWSEALREESAQVLGQVGHLVGVVDSADQPGTDLIDAVARLPQVLDQRGQPLRRQRVGIDRGGGIGHVNLEV